MGEVSTVKCRCGQKVEMLMEPLTYLPKGVSAGRHGRVECPNCELILIEIHYVKETPLDFIAISLHV